MKISDAKKLLTEIVVDNLIMFERGVAPSQYTVPFLSGDPGVGKTAVPKQVAKELGLPYFQTIVAQFDPGELAGLPFMGQVPIKRHNAEGKEEETVETRMIRLRPAYLPDINDVSQHMGIYNLDELPQAMLAGQNVMSQLTNEWRIGEHRISNGISICCTGNKPENKAGTTSMPMHLRDRLMFIPIDVDADDWLLYASADNGYGESVVNPLIRSFIRKFPQHLHKFELGANAMRTPRSWEKASNILRWKIDNAIRAQALAGTIGEGAATEFEAWLRVEDRMPDPDAIIKDPDSAPVFGNKDADVLYLLCASLADKAKKENIGRILRYMDRLPNKEFIGYFAKDAFNRDKSLLDVKEVTDWKMTTGAKLLLS